ncbi:hypothetical protein Dimus_013226 [Dionaea muscipula]
MNRDRRQAKGPQCRAAIEKAQALAEGPQEPSGNNNGTNGAVNGYSNRDNDEEAANMNPTVDKDANVHPATNIHDEGKTVGDEDLCGNNELAVTPGEDLCGNDEGNDEAGECLEEPSQRWFPANRYSQSRIVCLHHHPVYHHELIDVFPVLK